MVWVMFGWLFMFSDAISVQSVEVPIVSAVGLDVENIGAHLRHLPPPATPAMHATGPAVHFHRVQGF